MAKQNASATRHVRVAEDVAEKLGEIIEVEEGTTSAGFLDPLIRVEIENRHRVNLRAIQAMRAARQQVRAARNEPPILTNPLEAEGS